MMLDGAALDALGYASIDWDDIVATAMDVAERRARENAEKCRASYVRNIEARRAAARINAMRRYREKAAREGRVVGTRAKKLTPEQAAEVRASTEPLAVLAARYGVTQQAICYWRKKR